MRKPTKCICDLRPTKACSHHLCCSAAHRERVMGEWTTVQGLVDHSITSQARSKDCDCRGPERWNVPSSPFWLHPRGSSIPNYLAELWTNVMRCSYRGRSKQSTFDRNFRSHDTLYQPPCTSHPSSLVLDSIPLPCPQKSLHQTS